MRKPEFPFSPFNSSPQQNLPRLSPDVVPTVTHKSPFASSQDVSSSIWPRWQPISQTPPPSRPWGRPNLPQRVLPLPCLAPIAPSAGAGSHRTACASGGLPPATASSTRACFTSRPPVFIDRCCRLVSDHVSIPPSAARVGATGSPGCRRSHSATTAPHSPGTDDNSAASASPPPCRP